MIADFFILCGPSLDKLLFLFSVPISNIVISITFQELNGQWKFETRISQMLNGSIPKNLRLNLVELFRDEHLLHCIF